MSADYEGSVEQVHRAFSDEHYWLARLADSGADDATLDSMTVGADGGVDVVTTQGCARDKLPALVTQFHPGDLDRAREETWARCRRPAARGQVTGSILGRAGEAVR